MSIYPGIYKMYEYVLVGRYQVVYEGVYGKVDFVTFCRHVGLGSREVGREVV